MLFRSESAVGLVCSNKYLNVELQRCFKPRFKRRIYEMAINHNPTIMVITETRVGGDRAERIIVDLPFDGFITTETIGYVGGL